MFMFVVSCRLLQLKGWSSSKVARRKKSKSSAHSIDIGASRCVEPACVCTAHYTSLCVCCVSFNCLLACFALISTVVFRSANHSQVSDYTEDEEEKKDSTLETESAQLLSECAIFVSRTPRLLFTRLHSMQNRVVKASRCTPIIA